MGKGETRRRPIWRAAEVVMAPPVAAGPPFALPRIAVQVPAAAPQPPRTRPGPGLHPAGAAPRPAPRVQRVYPPDLPPPPNRPPFQRPRRLRRALALAGSVVLHAAAMTAMLTVSVRALRTLPSVSEPPSVPLLFAAATPPPQPPPPEPAPPEPAPPAPEPPPPAPEPPPPEPPPPPPPPAPTPEPPPPAAEAPPPEPAPLPIPPEPPPPPPPPRQVEAPRRPAEVRRPPPRVERRPETPVKPAPTPPRVAAPAAPPAPAPAALPIAPPSLPGGMAERCPPTYPRAARRGNVQGRVVMRVRVSADGRAVSAEVVASSGSPLLDRAAMEAVTTCRFVPATQGGHPVAFVYDVPYRFRLAD
ncbi:MAG TPA: TonB family protein [Acetobacteraceae bacterium]|nr:TonB family protein [Acetobacteraceae bacterium]